MTTYICCWWKGLKASEMIAFTDWKDLLLSSSLQQFPFEKQFSIAVFWSRALSQMLPEALVVLYTLVK